MESEGILVWEAFKDSSEIGSQYRTRGLQSEMECKMLCRKCWRQGGGRLSGQLKRKDCGVKSKLTLPWLSLGGAFVLFFLSGWSLYFSFSLGGAFVLF